MADLLEMQGECNYHLVRVLHSCGSVWVDFRECGDPNFSDTHLACVSGVDENRLRWAVKRLRAERA